MKFIANINQDNNHLSTIIANLIKCEEAYFAVAFLKCSGLNMLLSQLKIFLKRGGKIIIIAGRNFAITEPAALHEIKNNFERYSTSKLYLAKTNSADCIFHPKLYLFKQDNDCCIISGSANMTLGGLTKNREISITAKCNASDSIWIESKNYFNELMNNSNSEEASLLVIKQYETYYEQQKQYNKNSKPIPIKSKTQQLFNYNNLKKYYEEFDSSERQRNYNKRLRDYSEARSILDKIADNEELTQMQFEPLLDKLVGSKEITRLWHSGSLFRLRRFVYPYYNEFRELVCYIRDNSQQSADIVYESAKEKAELIKGAAENYTTEIMMTYNKMDFANINKNPIKVLREEGGVKIKATSSSYSGSDYSEYCNLIKEISSKLGLKNMLEADSFFNEVYWKIK